MSCRLLNVFELKCSIALGKYASGTPVDLSGIMIHSITNHRPTWGFTGGNTCLECHLWFINEFNWVKICQYISYLDSMLMMSFCNIERFKLLGFSSPVIRTFIVTPRTVHPWLISYPYHSPSIPWVSPWSHAVKAKNLNKLHLYILGRNITKGLSDVRRILSVTLG